jgi:hypothetical protein
MAYVPAPPASNNKGDGTLFRPKPVPLRREDRYLPLPRPTDADAQAALAQGSLCAVCSGTTGVWCMPA